MGEVICLDDVRKAVKGECSRVRGNQIFVGGRWWRMDELMRHFRIVGRRRFKDGVGC